jgi:hypothetical protein
MSEQLAERLPSPKAPALISARKTREQWQALQTIRAAPGKFRSSIPTASGLRFGDKEFQRQMSRKLLRL